MLSAMYKNTDCPNSGDQSRFYWSFHFVTFQAPYLLDSQYYRNVVQFWTKCLKIILKIWSIDTYFNIQKHYFCAFVSKITKYGWIKLINTWTRHFTTVGKKKNICVGNYYRCVYCKFENWLFAKMNRRGIHQNCLQWKFSSVVLDILIR